MDKEILAKYAYDPNMMQRYILEEIEKSNNNEVVITDPTNPFICLLEAATTTASNSLLEAKSVIRKTYPSLAVKPDDLYHHLTDDQMASMMATPGQALIAFFVCIQDLRIAGYQPPGANYKEIIIPIGTEITIHNHTMTLLNDILVRLYNNGNIFVEQQVNDNEVAYQDTGVIEPYITHDSNGIPYVLFETYVKQVKKTTQNIAITPSTGFTQIINITDKYFYSEVKYKNSTTNGQYKYLPKAFNDEYIDPLNPTCCIGIYDNSIEVRIPDIYLIEGQISGTVSIDVYETKGKIYLPINKYENSDFELKLGDTSKSPQAAAATNVLIYGNSRGILEGGVDSLSLLQLRDSIINNTTGDIDLPITEAQLTRFGAIKGYSILKTQDVITNRQYIAAKSLPDFNTELIYAKPDVIFNTAQFTLEDLENHNNIDVLEKRTIIKSGTLFRNINGKMVIVDNDETDGITSLTKLDLIYKLKDVKYYYNPFYYVITHDELISTVNVYDLDNPKISNKRILDRNITLNHRVNIAGTAILKTSTGYRIYFTTASNDEYQKLPQNELGYQARILLDNNVSYAYFDCNYDNNKRWYFDIKTTLNLDEEDTLDLQNGDSELYSKRFKLNTVIELISYTTSSTLKDPTHFLNGDIWKFNPKANYIAFGKDCFNVEFGKDLKYIWNKIYSTYTERKYLKYKEDVPLVYETDVYAKGDNGNIFTVVDDELKYTVEHRKGDPVLDENDQPIYKAKKGDVILDDRGLPTVDVKAGVMRYLDIMLLEYEFYKSTSSPYIQLNRTMLDAIRSYLITDLQEMNDILLEKTTILYKTFKKLSDVIVNINNNLYSTPCIVSPNVTLYIQGKEQRYTAEELENMKVSIGNTINKYFDKDLLVVNELREEIKNALGDNIASVKIDNIEPTNSEQLSLEDKTSKFILNKVLEVDSNNEYIVKYDITITAIYL